MGYNHNAGSMQNRGFTLLELMIVIAIIGILASIAVPNYFKTTKRAKFADVIQAASMYKLPATVAYTSGRIDNIAGLNGGIHGIPANLGVGEAVSPVVSTVELVDGVITAVSTNELGPESYTLTAEARGGSIRWIPGGSCFSSALC